MIYGKTHIGLVRETNEDAIFYDDIHNIMIIADGIGGHSNGEEASNKAIETLKNFIYKNFSAYPNKEELLRDGFSAANTAIHNIQNTLDEGKICGTTLTCALATQDVLYFAHVGDTRIYVSRGKKDIEQITYDHTYLSELARKDFKTFIELQESQAIQANNYLIKAIGPEASVEPQIGHFRLKHEDYIILLTDGIYRYVKPIDVLQFLKETNSSTQFVNAIFDRCLKLGGKDNLSLIIGSLLTKEGGHE